MFRLCGKLFKENRMIKDFVAENPDPALNRTRKIFAGLEQLCREFDLSVPIWLDTTIEDFKLHSKARFYQDSFIEHIDFDFLEIQVIEEDDTI